MSTKSMAAAAAPIKVLVIDDDAAHADAVADSLARVGYECRVATTANDGLGMIARDSFEVIVTDLRMRDGTGLDILAHAKQELPDAEVIVVTGHGTVQSAVEAMQQAPLTICLSRSISSSFARLSTTPRGRSTSAGRMSSSANASTKSLASRGSSATALRCRS
jgi:ActR/RegA family two-component response regulator